MPSAAGRPVRPIATIGLHGSASTWIFNVARELMVATVGEDRVLALYEENHAKLPRQTALGGRCFILKSHWGGPDLEAWIDGMQARVLLSVRDPRDAAISLTDRFALTLDRAVALVGRDCDLLVRLTQKHFPLWRYEDRFFDNPATVQQIMDALGIDVGPFITDMIFATYTTDAVKSFAARLKELPPDRQALGGALDAVTQIHRTHIGSTLSLKWHALPPARQADLTRVFGPFLDRFGYSR